MSKITFPALDEAQARLDAKRAEMGAFMAEAKTEDGTIDLTRVKSVDGDSDAKAAYFQRLNAEATDLKNEVDKHRLTKLAADAALGFEAEAGDGRTESGDDRPNRKAESKSFADHYFETKSAEQKGREFEIPDVNVKATFLTSAGWAPDDPREGRVVPLATRSQFSVLDLMPSVTTVQGTITYMEETTFTNAAVEVAEGAAKPEATLALTERTATVRKIAVFLPVTDEQLEDVAAAKEYIDSRLGFMVRQRLSSVILAGDGVAPNIRGILNVAGIQTQAKGADPTPDAVYKAMTKVRVTGQAEPDGVVFHPNDWQDVRLLRTTDGIYIWGNPSEAGPEMIWGLPVVQDQAETENTAVVGAWREYSTLFVRRGLTVETGYNADDWTKNKQTVRAEIRAVPVFWRPAAFCTVTGI